MFGPTKELLASSLRCFRRSAPVCLASLLFGLAQFAAGQPSPDGVEFFERKVRPLLAENCYSCHGPEKQKGKLRLDSAGAIRAGGETGPILVPGKPEESRLILAVSYKDEDLEMPPKTRLSERLVADLSAWVKSGAPLPPEDAPVVTAPLSKDFQISAKDRSHWAFQHLKRPEIPVLRPKGAA